MITYLANQGLHVAVWYLHTPETNDMVASVRLAYTLQRHGAFGFCVLESGPVVQNTLHKRVLKG